MKMDWFKQMGWIFVPVSWAGYGITFLTIFFCVRTFTAIDRHSHSVSDALYGVFPYVISAFVVFFWVAGHTCVDKKS